MATLEERKQRQRLADMAAKDQTIHTDQGYAARRFIANRGPIGFSGPSTLGSQLDAGTGEVSREQKPGYRQHHKTGNPILAPR